MQQHAQLLNQLPRNIIMSLTMQVFTLNCGNGSPGLETAAKLVQQFINSDSDLFIFNCQEVDFNQLIQEFQLASSKQPIALTGGQNMVTHTKPSTQFHSKTGIKTLVLHKSDITITVDKEYSQETRRETRRIGSGFNKGGMLTRFIVNKSGKSYTLDNINGHLDTASDAARAQDWANLHRLQKHVVNNWQELCEALPDVVCSGYDANTRNKLREDGSENAWTNIEPNMHSLVSAPFGNHRLSKSSTYHSYDPDILSKKDPKRAGRAKGGMLDIVGYTDKAAALQQLEDQTKPLVDDNASFIDPIPGKNRDHAVIGSNGIIIQDKNVFERVREAIGCALVGAAPELAAHLLSNEFKDTPEHQAYLLVAYQLYLSPEGLLQKYLQLHAEKLQALAKLKESDNPEAMKSYQQILFRESPWFTLAGDQVPESVEELNQLACSHRVIFELDALRNQFLNQAVSTLERDSIFLIVENALQYLPADSTFEEQKEWLKQAKQLLLFNQITHQYGRHLQQAKEGPQDTLLDDKRNIINQLHATLCSSEPPKTILSQLQVQLEKQEQLLGEHRHDDWLTSLFHKLKAILLRKPVISHGEFFASEAKSIVVDNLGQEQSDPDNEALI